jgi:hemoglobin
MDRAEVFLAIGGVPGCRALADGLYAGIARDPLLRPLFPGSGFRCAIEALSAFLVQYLGGPPEHSQFRWWLSLRESHARFRIGTEQRDAWMRNMSAALDGLSIDKPRRAELQKFFEEAATYLINSGQGAAPATHPFPLDDAVAAIRASDAERAILLTAQCDRTVFTGLLALMISGSNHRLLEYVREQLGQDPGLIEERYAGRTLLHAASAAGKIDIVEMLLELGCDPNVHDGGHHPPLYSVANECSSPGGPGVVHALVRAGSEVNAADGVQRCTALHMAARRGNLPVAEALLECGADPHIRDRSGATPLQRARNCRKTALADFLAAQM